MAVIKKWRRFKAVRHTAKFLVCLPQPLVVALMPHPGALWWNVVGVLTCKLVLKPNSSLTRGNS